MQVDHVKVYLEHTIGLKGQTRSFAGRFQANGSRQINLR